MIWAGLLDRGGWRLGGSVLRRAAMRFVEAEVDVGAGSVQPGGGAVRKLASMIRSGAQDGQRHQAGNGGIKQRQSPEFGSIAPAALHIIPG